VLRPLDFVLYDQSIRLLKGNVPWRVDEELLLLEAMEANGMGNWTDVAEQLGGHRSAEECARHYREIFLEPWLKNEKPEPIERKEMEASREILKQLHKTDGFKRAKIESEPLDAVLPSQPATHEIAGFMPLREEFEVEPENEAELLIKDLQFDEASADQDMKQAMLAIYSGVLDRRHARHAFVLRHALTEFKKHQAHDRARSRDERDLYGQLKPLARFLLPTDFQKLLEGLSREEELRRQIAHLQDLRRHGLRSFDEVAAFEGDRKQLELFLKSGNIQSATPSTFKPAQPVAVTLTQAALQKTSAVMAPVREPFPVPGPSSASEGGSQSQSQLHFQTHLQSQSPQLKLKIAEPSAIEAASPIAAAIPALSAPTPPMLSPAPVLHQPSPLSLGPASSGGRKASTPLNIAHSEGVDLLSDKERHLCSILRLYPRLYLQIKDTLVREYLKQGGLKRAQARAAVKIDVNKTSKLYDFFVAAGWIKPPASGE